MDMDKEGIRSLVQPTSEDIINVYFESIFVADNKGQVVLANPAASRILGIPKEKLIGANVSDLVAEATMTSQPCLRLSKPRKVQWQYLIQGTAKQLSPTAIPFLMTMMN